MSLSVLMVRVLVADRARLVVFEVVDTPFAKADIEVAVPDGVACLLGVVEIQGWAVTAISCGTWNSLTGCGVRGHVVREACHNAARCSSLSNRPGPYP